jgi:hypothetical protein
MTTERKAELRALLAARSDKWKLGSGAWQNFCEEALDALDETEKSFDMTADTLDDVLKLLREAVTRIERGKL